MVRQLPVRNATFPKLSNLVDASAAVPIGRMLGAEVLIVSKLAVKAGNAELFAKLVRVETGEVLSVANARVMGGAGFVSSVPPPSQGASQVKVLDDFDAATSSGATVIITNTDSRPVTDLRVTADFQIDEAAYTDWEDVGTFDKTITLALDGRRGKWIGSHYAGNMLYPQSAESGAKTLAIHKVDGRALRGLRISVNFRIYGSPHYGFKDVGSLSGTTNLVLNGGDGGTWDGSKWVGDFLHD